jgi:hypothetical protein
MTGRSQMQGGKILILPEEIHKCKPVLLRLSLAGNLDKPLLSLYGPNGGSVAMDSGLRIRSIYNRIGMYAGWVVQ